MNWTDYDEKSTNALVAIGKALEGFSALEKMAILKSASVMLGADWRRWSAQKNLPEASLIKAGENPVADQSK